MLNTLNEEQREIVYCDTNCLIIACPGSGKTRTLVAKMLYESTRLKLNQKIVAITYTNAAADEISFRLNESGIEEKVFWAGTIHSFCIHWILRPFSGLIDETRKGYNFLTEIDRDELIKYLKDKYFGKKYVEISTRRTSHGIFVSQDDNDLTELLVEYDEYLQKNKLLDFDLILYYSYRILKENTFIAKNLSTIFSWIMVDEFQDTQELQYLILGEIVKSKQNRSKILIVGDPNQAIYGSLGGFAMGKHEIEHVIGGFGVDQKFLVGNYRSTQNIIDFYSSFQLTGETIESKGLHRDVIADIHLDTKIGRDQLAETITNIITRLKSEENIPYEQIGVIAPRWDLLINVARGIRIKNPEIPLDSWGLSPIAKDETNVFFHFSRLLLVQPSPRNVFIRKRWANACLDLLKSSIVEITDENMTERMLLRIINGFKSTELNGLSYLNLAFDYIEKALGVHFNNYLDISGALTAFNDRCKTRLKLLGQTGTLTDFQNGLEKGHGVSFITAHGCKGLEFHTVIAFGLLWGMVPNWNEIYKDYESSIETSRKLFYVICSRARNKLIMFGETGRTTRKGDALLVSPELEKAYSTYKTRRVTL